MEDSSPSIGTKVPIHIAEKGLGTASTIPIPLDIWNSIVHRSSLQAVKFVEIPQPKLLKEVQAMTNALIQ